MGVRVGGGVLVMWGVLGVGVRSGMKLRPVDFQGTELLMNYF